jgi:hypothetical protein
MNYELTHNKEVKKPLLPSLRPFVPSQKLFNGSTNWGADPVSVRSISHEAKTVSDIVRLAMSSFQGV